MKTGQRANMRFDVYVFGETEPRVCIRASGLEEAEDEVGQDLGISPAKLYAVVQKRKDGGWPL